MNSPFDNDLDAFLIYDQPDQTPMSSSSDVKPVPALLHHTPSAFSQTSEAFSGPSYQYDSHRQQTGLPMGGYANTLAVNQASGLHYRPNNHGFVIPTDTLNLPLSNLNDFDFNRPQSYDFPEMDMEPESAGMYFADEPQSSTSPAVQRIFPGFHTQKANQAKIQQAQKQQEMVKQQQNQMPAGQQPLPTSMPKPQSPVVKDPHVEESISRLLNRMRQSSNASVDDGDSPDGGSNMPRFKKDEEDMDEDERLLNSEEGKKLSSKERRQLRNKVSARAFRSRRKGMFIIISNHPKLTSLQNTSVNSKQKSLRKHKRQTSSVCKTDNSWKRILVSPTSLVCSSHRNPSQVSSKSSASQEMSRLLLSHSLLRPRSSHNNSSSRSRPNHNNNNSHHARISQPTRLHVSCRPHRTTCKSA